MQFYKTTGKYYFFKSSHFLLRSHFKNHVRSYQQHQAANEMRCNRCKLIRQHHCGMKEEKNEFLKRQEETAHKNHNLPQWYYFGSSSRELRLTHPSIYEGSLVVQTGVTQMGPALCFQILCHPSQNLQCIYMLLQSFSAQRKLA